MNWLFPGFLVGAALIGVPVVLHLLRRKPQQMIRFPSLRFLGESALRDTRRNQLLRWLTLLLRCAAIVLLCAAFARPFWGRRPTPVRCALVLVLDNSMSQQARGRWEATLNWSQAQLDTLGPGDQAALLVMEPEPTWVVPMTDDLIRIKTALSAAKAGYDKTRYSRPLRLASDTLAKTDAATKIVAWAADEQRTGWRGTDFAEKLPPGIEFRFMDIATAPQRQAAIISVHPAAAEKDPLDLVIRQFQPNTPDHRKVEIYAGDRVIATQVISLRPGDNKVSVHCPWPAGVNGLRVSIEPDDLPADDSAWIAAATSITNRVLLDAAVDTDVLTDALRSTQKLPAAGLAPDALPDHAWPADAVVILRNESSFRAPVVDRLDQFCNAGGTAWILVDGSAPQKEWLKRHGVKLTPRPTTEEPCHLRDWDAEHPALAAFAGQSLLPLLEVQFRGGFNLSGESLAPIADWPDGKMAIAELETGGSRLLLAGFPLARETTDWPAQPSFVPFVHCVACWLGAFKNTHTDWRVGDSIPLENGAGTWHALDTPVAQKDVAVDGSVRTALPGLYEYVANGTKQIFAVNTPVDESDLSPWPASDQLASLESATPAPTSRRVAAAPAALAASENRQRLWWWMLAAGGGALLMELALANRTAK